MPTSKKNNRSRPNRSESGPNQNRSKEIGGERPTPSPNQFLPPDPPQPRPALYLVSGALMVGWIIFLFVVAINR